MKNKTQEHKDLQMGQQSVQFEERVWNRADIVLAQVPKRKKVGMRRMKRKNKNTGTQRLTDGSNSCSCRGSRLESC